MMSTMHWLVPILDVILIVVFRELNFSGVSNCNSAVIRFDYCCVSEGYYLL
jgi:hypothetical protein